MNILTVIPIARGIGRETLTYFSKQDAPVGSLVSIPLRGKKSHGLVVASELASDVKSELKNLSYNLRKIEDVQSAKFLSQSFIQSAQKIADYNATTVGAVLSALIPNPILQASENLSYQKKEKPAGVFYETALIQSDNEERYATYRSLIREEFAKSRSVFFCLPGIEDLFNAKGVLEKGIEKYTYTLHSGLSKKELVKLWQTIISETHPVLIISTGSFLSLPRDDIGTIIVEKESSRAYKMQSRPFLDVRTVAEILAKESGIRLVFGDLFLRVETLWKNKHREENPAYSELSPLKFHLLSGATCELSDMRAPADAKSKEFSIFGDKLKKMLERASQNNERTFLFCGRKGLYPHTVCSDCGTIVICKNCNAPVVLYGKPASTKGATAHKGNLFVCHHCGERRDAHELCGHCGGWRLLPLGIGIENVARELQKIVPNTTVVVLDKDHVTTHKQAVKARDVFYNSPGAICLGTEMALPYLKEKMENTAIVSLDSFFSIPDFRINEKIFHILLSLRALSEKEMLVQTRKEDTKIFQYALRGNLLDFYRDEVEDRKTVGYPPFFTYIKVTLEGEKNAVKKEMLAVAEALKPFELAVFDAWNPGSKAKFTAHGLVSLPKGQWVDGELLGKLRTLPPHCQIKIDPDTLL